MNDLLVFALLFAAIGIGWWLGRRSASAQASEVPGQYYKGLNYLLDGRPDGAVDAFIDALEVNSETLETHIALGNLLRKRGEVDRAIRIHQNLLARTSLPRPQIHQAHLELARDYISAGLFDRAERLLLDLVKDSPEQRRASRRHLLDIFQSQREWAQAVDVATALLPRKSLLGPTPPAPSGASRQPVAVALAHYHCELAAEMLEQGDLQEARKQLQQALHHDRRCVRASLMLGELECQAGQYKAAIKALRKVQQQDPDYIPETVPALHEAYSQLGDTTALRQYLQECLQSSPATGLVVAVADDVRATQGDQAAMEFLSGQLTKAPSLGGLSRLIELQAANTEGSVRDNLAALQKLVARLLAERPSYRCGHCGFAGRQLHWFCPGCKHWGTVKSIRGNRVD